MSVAIFLVLAYLGIGFAPFNWEAWPSKQFENGAVWSTGPVLHFTSRGIVHTQQPPDWLGKVKETSSLTVSLQVRSNAVDQGGPARILTISVDPQRRNLTVGQKGPDLIVRLRHPASSLNGTPDYVVPDVFETPGWKRLKVQIEPGLLVIHVEQERVAEIDLPNDTLANWSQSYKLALGNELTGGRAWLGSIKQAAVEIENNPINYLLRKSLYTPSLITIPDRYLEKPTIKLVPFSVGQDSTYYVSDIVLNFFGFIPLGFLFMMIPFLNRSLLVALTLCAVLSLSIELGQLFLPLRVTSIDDLILNTFGGLCGALGARFVGRQGIG